MSIVAPRVVSKPWGEEVIWAETEGYVGKLIKINAGHRLSLQYHEVKEETVFVVSGTLYVYDGDGNIAKLNPGESYHVTPGQIHRFGANESNVQIVEVSTPHLNDVVRLSDDYNR